MNERIMTRADLLASGLTSRDITAAVRTGRVVRLRRDRYAMPAGSAHVALAVATGGRIGCVTALAAAGVWTGADARTHISLDPLASRIRRPDPRGAVLHWRSPLDVRSRTASMASIADALIDAAHCLPFELAVASMDSALNLGLLPRERLADIRSALPRRLRRVVDRADGRCMSGLETLLRLALEDAGIPFDVQVRIQGVGTVDFVVGGHLVVETDGEKWHGGEQIERDYDRDLAAARAGYVGLRLNYRQVMFERATCLEAIRVLLQTVHVHSS